MSTELIVRGAERFLRVGVDGDGPDAAARALARLREESSRDALEARGVPVGFRLEDAVSVDVRGAHVDAAAAARLLGRVLGRGCALRVVAEPPHAAGARVHLE